MYLIYFPPLHVNKQTNRILLQINAECDITVKIFQKWTYIFASCLRFCFSKQVFQNKSEKQTNKNLKLSKPSDDHN